MPVATKKVEENRLSAQIYNLTDSSIDLKYGSLKQRLHEPEWNLNYILTFSQCPCVRDFLGHIDPDFEFSTSRTPVVWFFGLNLIFECKTA